MDNSPAAHGLSIANFGNLVSAVVGGGPKKRRPMRRNGGFVLRVRKYFRVGVV